MEWARPTGPDLYELVAHMHATDFFGSANLLLASMLWETAGLTRLALPSAVAGLPAHACSSMMQLQEVAR